MYMTHGAQACHLHPVSRNCTILEARNDLTGRLCLGPTNIGITTLEMADDNW